MVRFRTIVCPGLSVGRIMAGIGSAPGIVHGDDPGVVSPHRERKRSNREIACL